MADGLTKALGPERHKRLAKAMGMSTWSETGDHQMRSGSDGQTSSPASPFMAGGDMAVGTVCDVTWPSARHST